MHFHPVTVLRVLLCPPTPGNTQATISSFRPPVLFFLSSLAHSAIAENASEADQSNRSVQATSLRSAPLDLSSAVPCPVISFYTSNELRKGRLQQTLRVMQ